jgi:choline kinase
MKKAAILAAGEGSRIKSMALFKPIVKINGTALLELTYQNLNFKKFHTVSIIFNDDQKEMDLTLLPSLLNPSVKHFFKSTPSSMHSLLEVTYQLDLKKGEHLFVSMVDSIVLPSDAFKFHQFCSGLKSDESAILITSHIEDEKPLTLKLNAQGFISEFQCPLGDDVLITSGVYCFSENIFSLLREMVEAGHCKMRTFLTELVKRNYKLKGFELKKTLDIDRPEDIPSAEMFLTEKNL